MTTKHKERLADQDPVDRAAALSQLSALTGSMANTFARASQAYLQGITSLNSEVADFVAERWRCDLNLSQSIAHCENWAQVASLQQDWIRRAAQDYLGEVTKLMQLASTSAFSAWNPLASQAPSHTTQQTKSTSKPA
jgi:hypothetical protein